MNDRDRSVRKAIEARLLGLDNELPTSAFGRLGRRSLVCAAHGYFFGARGVVRTWVDIAELATRATGRDLPSSRARFL
jgi:hypothetical protein